MERVFTVKNSNMAKGLAILLLLMYHLFENEEILTSQEVIYSPFSQKGFLTFSGFGNICVAMFVFLTSFGIAKGLFSSKEWDARAAYGQAARRFGKLMANFAVLYLSVNLLWWYKFDYASLYGEGKQGILMALTDACGLSMFFDTPTMNMTWWYMEIAYLLIFLAPVLVWLVRRTGYCALLIAAFLPFVLTVPTDIRRYLFVAVFGVCAAYGKWLDRLLQKSRHLLLQWIFCILGFVLCVLVRQNYIVYTYYVSFVDAPIAFFLVYFAGVVMGTVPVLRDVLAFIGRHSLNIYLVHTFFYMALWQRFIYSFHYAGITFLLLLACCLLYSAALEWVKRGAVKLWKNFGERKRKKY